MPLLSAAQLRSSFCSKTRLTPPSSHVKKRRQSKQNLCVIEFVLVLFGCTSCEFGGVMARIWRDSLAKISMVIPNEPDIPPKLTKTKDRLGRKNTVLKFGQIYSDTRSCSTKYL